MGAKGEAAARRMMAGLTYEEDRGDEIQEDGRTGGEARGDGELVIDSDRTTDSRSKRRHKWARYEV